MAQILAPYDVQSIYSKHPHLPQQLVHALKLDTSLAHNAPLIPRLIREAEATAVALERIQEFHDLITDAVVQTAKDRATLMSQAYTSAEFNVPAPPATPLMDATVALQAYTRNIEERLRRIEAWTDNTRIGKSNMRMLNLKGTASYRAKMKEVAGDGTALANSLAPDNTAPMAALPQLPVVGTAYAPTIETHDLSHQEILNLIRFYNDDFDIVSDDSIAAREQKVRQWLTFKVGVLF